jgi:hypothetical protein
MSNYKFNALSCPPQQGWGIASRKPSGLLEWCYQQGPGKFSYTERAAKLEAFVSNNENPNGTFVAVPIPESFASYDIDEDYYDAGPVSKERRIKSTAFRAKLLRGEL